MLKLGEQSKIPGVNITKHFANLSGHWKLPYMKAEEYLSQYAFFWSSYVGIIYVTATNEPVA